MPFLKWSAAAGLLVVLIVGTGAVFASFFGAGSGLGLTVALGAVGLSGSGLACLNPSRHAVQRGSLKAVVLLPAYAVVVYVLFLAGR